MILAVLIYLLVCLIYQVDAQNNQNYSNNNRFKHTQGVFIRYKLDYEEQLSIHCYN